MNLKYELSDEQTLSERDRLNIIFMLYLARVLKNEREKNFRWYPLHHRPYLLIF